MSDPQNPQCPHGGKLIRPGVMDCPRYHDKPHVGVCNNCLERGSRWFQTEEVKTRSLDSSDDFIASMRQICFGCLTKCSKDLSKKPLCKQVEAVRKGDVPTCPKNNFVLGDAGNPGRM